MTPLSFPLAVALLTAPVDAALDNPGVPLPVLQRTAEALDLLDHRECRYTFADPAAVRADVLTIRKRWADLHDAPPLCAASVRRRALPRPRTMQSGHRAQPRLPQMALRAPAVFPRRRLDRRSD